MPREAVIYWRCWYVLYVYMAGGEMMRDSTRFRLVPAGDEPWSLLLSSFRAPSSVECVQGLVTTDENNYSCGSIWQARVMW